MAYTKMALEFRANQLEQLTGQRVTGGVVSRRGVRFRLAAAVAPDLTHLRQLFGRGVRVGADGNTGGEISIRLGQLNRVPLGQLIAGRELPRLAPVLGVNDSGAPLLLNMVHPVSRHLLVADADEQGKTLLQTAALSLAMLNRQQHLQLVAIGKLQQLWGHWPHLLKVSLAQVTQLARSAEWQRRQNPHLVVVIEDLERLTAAEQADVQTLLQADPAARLHLIAAGGAAPVWPATAVAQRTTDESDLYNLVVGSHHAELHAAAATQAEVEAAIIQLRVGRRSRMWTVQETLPPQRNILRRLLGG